MGQEDAFATARWPNEHGYTSAQPAVSNLGCKTEAFVVQAATVSRFEILMQAVAHPIFLSGFRTQLSADLRYSRKQLLTLSSCQGSAPHKQSKLVSSSGPEHRESLV